MALHWLYQIMGDTPYRIVTIRERIKPKQRPPRQNAHLDNIYAMHSLPQIKPLDSLDKHRGCCWFFNDDKCTDYVREKNDDIDDNGKVSKCIYPWFDVQLNWIRLSIDQCNAWGEKFSEEFEFWTLLMDDVYQLNDFINKLSENLFLTGLDWQLAIATPRKEFKLEALYLEIQWFC